MNIKEIEKKIQEEMNAFNGAVCTLKVPSNLVTLFIKALFFVPPASHKLTTKFVESVQDKKSTELTNFEVRKMINVVVGTPPFRIYANQKSYQETAWRIEQLIMETNLENAKKEEELSVKKTTLMQLAGIGVQRPKIHAVN